VRRSGWSRRVHRLDALTASQGAEEAATLARCAGWPLPVVSPTARSASCRSGRRLWVGPVFGRRFGCRPIRRRGACAGTQAARSSHRVGDGCHGRRWLCCSSGFEKIDIADIPDVPDLPRAAFGQPGPWKVPSRLIVSVISSVHGQWRAHRRCRWRAVAMSWAAAENSRSLPQQQRPASRGPWLPGRNSVTAMVPVGPAPVAVTSSPHHSHPGCWIQDRPSETGRGLGHRP